MNILIFDTSVSSRNLGDTIIMQAVTLHLKEIFQTSRFLYSFTHERIGKAAKKFLEEARFSFIGGTNLLSSTMNRHKQWRIYIAEMLNLRNIVLMGVGWQQYQARANLYSKILYRSILHPEIIHAVRDSYTEKMLKDVGLSNILNTGCPTIWNLSADHCSLIPSGKAKSVLFTFTHHRRSPSDDRKLIRELGKNYQNIYFWPQGLGDMEYLSSLKVERQPLFRLVHPSMEAVDDLLGNDSID